MRIRDWSSDVCSSDLSAPCEARNRKEAAFVRGHNRLKAASMTDSDMSRPLLRILIAAPRGFCAGVDRAIHIVERAIEKYGAPVYVRHEIVHNKRSEEHTSELQSLMRISYAVFCLKKKNKNNKE